MEQPTIQNTISKLESMNAVIQRGHLPKMLRRQTWDSNNGSGISYVYNGAKASRTVYKNEQNLRVVNSIVKSTASW